MDTFEIVSQGDGEYLVRVVSLDGNTSVTIDLDHAGDDSAGRLGDDEATARATIKYLLTHQDASDLPERIELGDLLAAYPDGVDRIEALRD
ncbi:hypothetical protein [Tessaracoccus antarcticus]|uniref:Uncharacterized protein n=1 Tax=Tessaracoccus antarcticus TaxID=2479848 RepID=A0A3M0G5L2_9ACTN|nr:hypothetical protein [Tessaracoccus antarcticus]RMB60134.1 hypothetical protein EAX62_10595 [Tessaracoccus antarcticus]